MFRPSNIAKQRRSKSRTPAFAIASSNLCTNAKVVCTGDVTVAECAKTDDFGNKKGGFVLPREPRQTCLDPVKEINWCQVSTPPKCQELTMVHELAHACGWKENTTGFGVPGDSSEGAINCK